MGLSPEMLKALEELKFESPTEVQYQSIIPMLNKKDMLIQAPTGTGKTVAFGIPIIENIDIDLRAIQCVIICPTRELAQQIRKSLHDLTKYKPGIRVQALYGGEHIQRQIAALRRMPQIVVSTPGRLQDHIRRRTAKLQNVNTVVLDEADIMLDMGFRGEIENILKSIPEEVQTALFSATLSKDIKKIASTYQKSPVPVTVKASKNASQNIQQFYVTTNKKSKNKAFVSLLETERFKSPLVFVATKAMADRNAKMLTELGFKADSLHGDMQQKQRNRVMSDFRQGKIEVLVATDIASRGIDVKDVGVVINYDMPGDTESYIHRIGRTGRAKQSGTAYTIISPPEKSQIQKIITDTSFDIMPLRVDASDLSNEIIDLPVSKKPRSRNKNRNNKNRYGKNSGKSRAKVKSKADSGTPKKFKAKPKKKKNYKVPANKD